MFYYRLAGAKLIYVFVITTVAVGFEGFGLGLFLPIFEGENSKSKISLLLREAFNSMGIEYRLHYILLFFVFFYSARSVSLIAQSALVSKIMADLLVTLRWNIAKKIFELDYQFFQKKTSGYLNNAIIVEFQNVVFSFKIFASVMVSTLFAALYLTVPLVLNPTLILILTATGIPAFFAIKKINQITKKYSIRTSHHSAGLQKILIQSLRNYKYLKATSEYPNILKHIFSQSKILGKLQFRQGFLGAISQDGFQPFMILIIACIIFYYVEFKGEDILKYLFLLYLLYSAMVRILIIQTRFRKLLNSWGSIKVLNNLESDLEKFKEKKETKNKSQKISFEKPILFKNVSFNFDNGKKVLSNVSIKIPANKTVAVVGESGSGKTTLINMLVGLLRPTEGSIYIGDRAYSELDIDSLRKKIGYITQESVVFHDTIYNNITLWNNTCGDNDEKVKSAASKADIDTFIHGLEKGYDTMLGESGINISGGQRQRLCIAREIYKDAKILIFDEATSSLDTKTEKEIQKNIDEFRGKKTIILIAHRLSTVRNADIIFCLKNGRIIEQGTYEELYNANKEFKRMVDQQNQ